MYMHLLI